MPLFPLPIGGAGIDGGDLPVTSADDVLALLPAFVRDNDTDPVRDAIAAALAEVFLEYQRRADYASAQSDVLRSTGRYLDEFFEKRGIYRALGESDPDLRARGLAIQDYVTPTAILAATDSLLAPYTKVKSRYAESIHDRWFVHDGGDHPWHSHVYSHAGTNTPTYPDRLYPRDAAANGGYACPQREPMGAMAFGGHGGRQFLLRVPDLSPIDDAFSSVWSQNHVAEPQAAHGFFIRTGVVTGGGVGTFIRQNPGTAQRVYETIINTIDRIKAHSIRWVLIADPRLTS